MKKLKNLRANIDLEDSIRKKLNFSGKITPHLHHLCHLASSYYPSGFDESLVKNEIKTQQHTIMHAVSEANGQPAGNANGGGDSRRYFYNDRTHRLVKLNPGEVYNPIRGDIVKQSKR